MIENIVNIIQSPTFWGLLTPILSAVIAWLMNEKSKRKWENYKKREERYINLINHLDGFYSNTEDTSQKHNFILELRLCWLYAPDEVIKAANNFLITCRNGTDKSQYQQDASIGKLILEIRKDLKNTKTKLLEDDFLHWKVN